MSLRSITPLLMLFFSIVALADEVYVPEELEPWRSWVLHDKSFVDCPWNATKEERTDCAWLNSIKISVTRGTALGEASFVVDADVFGDTNVMLPFALGHLPQRVTVDGTAKPVVNTTRGPTVPLKPGRYTIEGKLVWPINIEPSYFRIPDSAFLHFDIEGTSVGNVRLDEGRLWMHSRRQQDTADTLNIKVYRYLEDGPPLTLTTQLTLNAEGQNRTVDLGKVLPDSFVITSIESRLPFRVDEDGSASVQLTRGTSSLRFTARGIDNVQTFEYHKANRHWPEVEYWGWHPKRDIRLVRIEGPPTIDLDQINYPFRTTDRAGFALSEGVSMRLIEEQRGNVNPYPARFKVDRELWLSFDGDSFIAKDRIEARTDSETAIAANYVPGKVSVNMIPRLVTYSDAENLADAGVNLSERFSIIEAVSLLDRTGPLHAVGWKIDTSSLMATLNLPPGWRLLWTRGVDHVTESWLSSWSIWDIFLAVLLVALVYRVGGPIWAGIVALAVVLSYQEHAATTLGFLVLAAIAALIRIIDHEGFRRFLLGSYWVLIVPIAIACVFYSTYTARQAIYPQLERLDSSERYPESQIQSIVTLKTSARGITEDSAADQQYRASRREGRADELKEEVLVTGAFIARSNFDLPTLHEGLSGVQIPTGPGIPTWNWRQVALEWSGPVSKEQSMSLTLLSPAFFRVLSFGSAALTLLVMLFFVLRHVPPTDKVPPILRAVMPAMVLFLFVPHDAFAEVPNQRILDELERRLLAPPSCVPECVHLESALVEVHPNELKTELIVHAAAEVAVALPESTGTWTHDRLTVNGVTAPLTRIEGQLFVLLDEGVHTIRSGAAIADFTRIDIVYPIVPGLLRYDVEGWLRQGVGNVVRSSTHTFERIDVADSTQTTTLVQDSIDPYVRVTRVLNFGFDPRVETSITRVSPENEPFSVVIPLLSGETMLADEFVVDNGAVTVNFPANIERANWVSRLEVGEEISLTAPPIRVRQEVWTLLGSDFWHYTYAGLTPVKATTNGTTFYPRSNESLNVSLKRPKPAEGDWITVQKADLTVEVGNRSTNAELTLSIEASQSSEFDLELPDGARITEINARGNNIPIPASGEILLPLTAGTNHVSVSWLADEGARLFYGSPMVELQQFARNIGIEVRFPESRWTLLLGGPPKGSAVLFWGIAIVVLVIAVGLSRLEGFPISTPAAVLLTFGASIANLWALLFAGAWFIAIWWRNRNDFGGVQSPYYAFGQFMFLLVSVLAIGVLVATVPVALLGQPDMLITGEKSSAWNYYWYADHSSSTLPTAWVVSLPHWVYLIAMFAWSFWLATALVNWVRLAWQAVSQPQFWPPRKPKARKPAKSDDDAAADETESTDDQW